MTTEHPIESLAEIVKASYLAHGFFITTHKGFRDLEVKDEIANITWVEALPKPTVIDSGILKNPHDPYRFIEERVYQTASAFGIFAEKEDASTGFKMMPLEGWPGLRDLMEKMEIKPAEKADPQTDRIDYQKGAILAQKISPSVETVFFLSADKKGQGRIYHAEAYKRVCSDAGCPANRIAFSLFDRLGDTNETGSHQWVESHWRKRGGRALCFVRFANGGWGLVLGADSKVQDLAIIMAQKGQPQIT